MKILVAEDDIAACSMYKIALSSRGHNVMLTHDGHECIEAYRQELCHVCYKDTPFDAVILDYQMPNVNGLEAAKEILSLNKRQRIVFASAYVKETLQDSIIKLDQIVELLQKPFEPRILVEMLEDVSATTQLEQINMILSATDKNTDKDSQTDYLLRVLRQVQKLGF